MKARMQYLYTLVLILLQQGCIKGILNTEEYSLPNSYEYFVPQSGMHMLIRPGVEGIVLGYHLNRAYVDDRYIAGEILLNPERSAELEQEPKFSYFVLDTKSSRHISDLNEIQFEEELRRLGLLSKVELVGRDSRCWLSQCANSR